MTDSIMDRLHRKITAEKAELPNNEEILVPGKCAHCKSNAICLALPTFINFSRIGIIVGVEDCPYHIPSD